MCATHWSDAGHPFELAAGSSVHYGSVADRAPPRLFFLVSGWPGQPQLGRIRHIAQLIHKFDALIQGLAGKAYIQAGHA